MEFAKNTVWRTQILDASAFRERKLSGKYPGLITIECPVSSKHNAPKSYRLTEMSDHQKKNHNPNVC